MDAVQTTLNDETTEQLRPDHRTNTVKKSCCFYIPRRLRIIILALIKLVLSFGLFVALFYILFLSYKLLYLIWYYRIMTQIAITLDVIDVVISLLVIISVCENNRSIMKMYYLYSIWVFGALIIVFCVIVYFTEVDLVALLIYLLIFFLGFMMQAYLIQLLKSEVMKLESSEQFLL